jgi:hypothetical protein
MNIAKYKHKKTGKHVLAYQMSLDISCEEEIKKINEFLKSWHAVIKVIPYINFQTSRTSYNVSLELSCANCSAGQVLTLNDYIYVTDKDEVRVAQCEVFKSDYIKELNVERREVTLTFETVQISPENLEWKDCLVVDDWLQKDDHASNRIVFLSSNEAGSLSSHWVLRTQRHGDTPANSGDYIVKLYAGGKEDYSNFVVVTPDEINHLDKCLCAVFKRDTGGGRLQ